MYQIAHATLYAFRDLFFSHKKLILGALNDAQKKQSDFIAEMVSLFQEFVTGADSFGQLSNGISNSIISEILYWLIAAIIMGILFLITGFMIIGIGYQVGKIYRKYCWDIISIMMAIMSTAIVIYFGEWIKSVILINLIVLLLLVYVVYIGIRCYVKDWQEERGYY